MRTSSTPRSLFYLRSGYTKCYEPWLTSAAKLFFPEPKRTRIVRLYRILSPLQRKLGRHWWYREEERTSSTQDTNLRRLPRIGQLKGCQRSGSDLRVHSPHVRKTDGGFRLPQIQRYCHDGHSLSREFEWTRRNLHWFLRSHRNTTRARDKVDSGL